MSETIKKDTKWPLCTTKLTTVCHFDYARFVTLLKGFISNVSNSINFLKNELNKLQILYGPQRNELTT